MANYREYGCRPDSSVTLDEARAMPTFYRVARINKTVYSCDDCAACRAEPWVNGSACDAHTEEHVAYPAGSTWNHHRDAELALKVYRAGGSPEPRYSTGIGAAQWNYRRPRKAADRNALVLAITTTTTAAAAA